MPVQINDSGVVVGTGTDATGMPKDFLYSRGIYTELLPPGWANVELISLPTINKWGVVAGSGSDGTAIKGYIYKEGSYVELQVPGWPETFTIKINDRGDVVGTGSDADGNPRGFLYSGGTYTQLLPPGSDFAQGLDVNNNGAAVGWAFYPDIMNYRGFIYAKGSYTELLPPGWKSANPLRINDSGAVIGYGYGYSNRGFLYMGGGYIELLPPGWIAAFPSNISATGVVVGSGTDAAGISKGFLYDNGVYTELLPPGWISAIADNLDDEGGVVGYGTDALGTPRAFLYSAGTYTGFLPPGWANIEFGPAPSINSWGAMTVSGFDGTVRKGFIATPQPSITEILVFFDSSLSAVTLEGNGRGNLARGRLKAMRNMLSRMGDLSGDKSIGRACRQLRNVYNRTDGGLKPPDFVKGPAALELANLILSLRASLACP